MYSDARIKFSKEQGESVAPQRKSPANENANGLIRQFFPKKTSFENITDEQVKWVEEILNNRPRKRLGFLTPKEKLEEILFNKKVAFAMKIYDIFICSILL